LKRLILGALIGVLSLAGTVAVAATASAGSPARHIAGAPVHPPTDQRVLVGICFQLPTLQRDMGQAVHAYQPHKGMAEAGLWVNNQFYSGNDWAGLDKLVCVVTTVPPPTPAPPIATTTTVASETTTTEPVVTTLPSHPEHPCPYDVADCAPHIGPLPCLLPFNDHERVAAGNYGGEPGFQCEPHHHPVPPIATTTTMPVVTTLPVTSTTEAPTTTVPVPVTRCIIVRRVQICTLPHETTTTVEQTTTTEAPTTSTTVEETTTTEAPTTTTTAAPETPCTGIDDCHIVCNDAAGVDDCNICIGNDSCDVIECPIGYTVEANGDCDLVPAPPIETTTTVPVATTLPATTTSTEETTTTAVPVPLSVPCHGKSWCHSSS
jgi:hypothetical protein